MLILGVDTSGKNGSLALVRCEANKCEALDVAPLSGGSYSAQLVPQLAAMLERNGIGKQAVDGYAVASGPGSFTGLRVGLSAVKALAVALKKPIAAVSVLQAVAAAAKASGRVLAALDDNRGHIYTGEYQVKEGDLPVKQEEALLTLDEFASRVEGATVVTPDAKLAQALLARGIRLQEIERPGADFLAQLGYRKLLAGETADPEMLDANYIRRSDAELFAKPSF